MNAAAPMPMSRLDSDRKFDADRSHEPSMDEILASIRRIISEDQVQLTSRTAAPADVASATVKAAPPVVEQRPVRSEGLPSSRGVTSSELGSAVERLRRALEPVIEKTAETSILGAKAPPVAPAAPVRDAPAPEAPAIRPVQVKLPEFEMSVADVPAHAPARPVEAIKPDPVVSSAPAVVLDLPETALALEISAEAMSSEKVSPPPLAPTPFPTLDRAFPGQTPVIDRVSTQSVAPAPVAEVRADVVAPASDSDTLLSPSADASIASSFQTLATSMLFQDKGLVEEMVREMLRPMLKNWLDDNLPVMVERLVRAEIERVARVGRG